MTRRPTVMIGGPIKAGFGPQGFNGGLRKQIVGLHDALEACGYNLRSAHMAEKWSPLSESERRTVARRDRQWLHESDAYIAFVPLDAHGQLVPSFGTGVEVGWAISLGKPVWLIIDGSQICNYSPFLTSLPEAMDVHLMTLGSDDTHYRELLELLSEHFMSGREL